VRCYSSRRAAEGLRVRTYDPTEIDAIVAYCDELDRRFAVLPAEFAGRRQFHLRLAPGRNNQRERVNWADDYALERLPCARSGAVAQLGERLAGSQKVRGSSPLGSTCERSARR
jgi:hypothetical protein